MARTRTTITARELEEEIRAGRDIVLLDTRDRDSFNSWHIEGLPSLRSVPEPEITADPDTALAGLPPDARLRVICHSGVGSQRVIDRIGSRFTEILNVTDGMIGWSRVLQSDPVELDTDVEVVQFRREARGCFSYLMCADGEALVVDPAPVTQPYVDEARRRGVRITRVFDTHIHADHVSGARELAGETGAALHLSTLARQRGLRYRMPVSHVVDGDELLIGNRTVRVVALPGHTTDMTGLLIGEAALVGGDSLFVDSVARPDLEAGAADADVAARQLYATLRDRLSPLPDETVLLPCHYPGGRRNGPLTATLGEVRRAVAELRLDREAFVGTLLAQLPPTPSNYQTIIAVNLGDDLPADEVARLEVGANNCAATREWDGAPTPPR